MDQYGESPPFDPMPNTASVGFESEDCGWSPGGADPAGSRDEWIPIGTADGELTVVDLDLVGTPDDLLVFDRSGHASVIAAGQPRSEDVEVDGGLSPADVAPPVAHSLTITLSDGTVIDAGVPNVDLSGDGVLDTARTVDGDSVMEVSDLDDEPGADRVRITEDGATTMLVDLDSRTGQWTPVDGLHPGDGAPGGDPAGIEVPDRYRITVDETADLATQSLARMQATAADAAADLWSAAYPGTPWPVDDDTGEPYPPRILLGVISADQGLDADVTTVARSVLDSLNRAIESIVEHA